VGHEIDLTISDLAADLRAPTPSAAAELLVVEKESLITRLEEIGNRLVSLIRLIIKDRKQELAHVSKGLHDPGKRLADTWMRLDGIHSRLVRMMELTIRGARKRLNTEARTLILHSPANIMTSLRQRLDFQKTSLGRAMHRSLADRNMSLSLLNKRIEDLSPLSILKRGYSITRKLPEKTVVRNTAGVEKGERVQVLLGEGQLECRVEKVTSDQ
jgi:exodeoxyribonuclease VII large subunit